MTGQRKKVNENVQVEILVSNSSSGRNMNLGPPRLPQAHTHRNFTLALSSLFTHSHPLPSPSSLTPPFPSPPRLGSCKNTEFERFGSDVAVKTLGKVERKGKKKGEEGRGRGRKRDRKQGRSERREKGEGRGREKVRRVKRERRRGRIREEGVSE